MIADLLIKYEDFRLEATPVQWITIDYNIG